MGTENKQVETKITQYSWSTLNNAYEIRNHIPNPIDRELQYARLLIRNGYVTEGNSRVLDLAIRIEDNQVVSQINDDSRVNLALSKFNI